MTNRTGAPACLRPGVPTPTSAFVLEVREIDHFLREDKQAQPPARVGLVVDGSRVRHDLLPFVHQDPAGGRGRREGVDSGEGSWEETACSWPCPSCDSGLTPHPSSPSPSPSLHPLPMPQSLTQSRGLATSLPFRAKDSPYSEQHVLPSLRSGSPYVARPGPGVEGGRGAHLM